MSKSKTIIIRIVIIAVILAIVGGTVGLIAKKLRELTEVESNLPDFVATPSDKNSWEYWDDPAYDDGSIVELDWYVNASSWRWSGNGSTAVAQAILEKTGVKINFSVPVTDDGEKLTTMIAGNALPDLVTLEVNDNTRISLAEEGYTFSITEMAKRWAPLFLDRYTKEIQDRFAATDGDLYGMPHLYYAQEDLDAYAEQGNELLPNTVFCAREDMLDWYQENYPDEDPTTPSGFIKMCKTVKTKCPLYTSDSGYSTVQLAYFPANNECESITKLTEYFAYAKEDENGNLKYRNADERYQEALLFINEMYREGLISYSNFTDSKSAVGANIQNGKPFVTLVTPQNYQNNFYQWNTANKDKEYVPIVFTNKDGDAPLLNNLAGTGYLYTMVSSNCERPDRVMKLLDFLSSDEGQLLMLYGIEGEHWVWDIQPGETRVVDGKNLTYKYGKVKWANEDVENVVYAGNSVVTYGFDFEILTNRMFDHMVNPTGVSLRNLSSFILYNQKSPLIPYTINPMDGAYTRDSRDKDYLNIVSMETKIKNLWIERASTILTQETAEDCMLIYNSTLATAKAWGYETILAFDNKYFQEYKASRGVKYCIPIYDEDYVQPEIKFRGYSEYMIEIPDQAWTAAGK